MAIAQAGPIVDHAAVHVTLHAALVLIFAAWLVVVWARNFAPDQPLGLPSGSVRAILSFMLLGGTMLMAALGISVPEVQWTLLGIAIRDYFASRQEGAVAAEPPKGHPPTGLVQP